MTSEQKNYMVWDKESEKKARKQHKYIFVTSDQKQRKYKLLSGADKAWNPRKGREGVEYVYVPDLRIMGTMDSVMLALKNSKFTDVEIKNYLKKSYTKDNHSVEYETELAQLADYKKSQTTDQKDKIKYALKDLGWFVDNLKTAKIEPIDKASSQVSKVSPKSKRDLFRDLYAKAQETDKILDVSTLETVGAKLRDIATKRGNKVKSNTLNIETDNLPNYTKAIEWAFGSTDNHLADIEEVKAMLAEKKKDNKTKATKKTPPKKTTPKKNTTPPKANPAKKKVMGSPRKAAASSIPTKGGDNFTSIPVLPKK